ncbi:hypothetical protein NC652_001664 [Populus alba x Populus x berolinensis]|nr:hypothetical protein NC652_001664 [Populus alba x Populus x berolinensis]
MLKIKELSIHLIGSVKFIMSVNYNASMKGDVDRKRFKFRCYMDFEVLYQFIDDTSICELCKTT